MLPEVVFTSLEVEDKFSTNSLPETELNLNAFVIILEIVVSPDTVFIVKFLVLRLSALISEDTPLIEVLPLNLFGM